MHSPENIENGEAQGKENGPALSAQDLSARNYELRKAVLGAAEGFNMHEGDSEEVLDKQVSITGRSALVFEFIAREYLGLLDREKKHLQGVESGIEQGNKMMAKERLGEIEHIEEMINRNCLSTLKSVTDELIYRHPSN